MKDSKIIWFGYEDKKQRVCSIPGFSIISMIVGIALSKDSNNVDFISDSMFFNERYIDEDSLNGLKN